LTLLTVLAVHVVSLAVLIAGIVRSGERPQVLLYAFIFDYGLRLLTISTATQVMSGRMPTLGWLASCVCSPPMAGERSSPVTEEGSGRPVGLSGYLVLLALFGSFGFVLSNVNAQRALDLDGATLMHDVRWAAVLALTYWLQARLPKYRYRPNCRPGDQSGLQHARSPDACVRHPGRGAVRGGPPDARSFSVGMGSARTVARIPVSL
jgi:hypothetical protein